MHHCLPAIPYNPRLYRLSTHGPALSNTPSIRLDEARENNGNRGTLNQGRHINIVNTGALDTEEDTDTPAGGDAQSEPVRELEHRCSKVCQSQITGFITLWFRTIKTFNKVIQ